MKFTEDTSKLVPPKEEIVRPLHLDRHPFHRKRLSKNNPYNDRNER